MALIETLFADPATPDLGCFVRRKHELHVEAGSQNVHVEFSPSVDFSPPPILEHFPPNFMLGGNSTPRPSDWKADAVVAHIYDIYENGTLSTVQYDDTGGDKDLNDLILEVAIVGRTWLNELVQASDQVQANARFEREALPRLGKELSQVPKPSRAK